MKLVPFISQIAGVPSSFCQRMSALPSPLKSPLPATCQVGRGVPPPPPASNDAGAVHQPDRGRAVIILPENVGHWSPLKSCPGLAWLTDMFRTSSVPLENCRYLIFDSVSVWSRLPILSTTVNAPEICRTIEYCEELPETVLLPLPPSITSPSWLTMNLSLPAPPTALSMLVS